VAYVGRFAPSPTGPLHRGSLVAALASWLDARAHGGRWQVRIEDVDTTRCKPEHEHTILAQLDALGLRADGPVLRQTDRRHRYAEALARLARDGRTFACACSRREIDEAMGAATAPRVYPGTCRDGLRGRPARSVRLRTATGHHGTEDLVVDWFDRRLGPQRQNVTRDVGDFVLWHLDGRYTYQLAVVVDDADQGVTDVVRGEDLADNTARQIALQQALGLPRPRYLHTPLVLAADGQKLSKQTGAAALDLREPLGALRAAAAVLGLPPDDTDPAGAPTLGAWLARAVARWQASSMSGFGRAAESGPVG
jgi:glutamyl-Q tRNA(Asp) synthetase